MSTAQWIDFLINALTDESYHFWLALASGLLGCWLTLTMFSAPFWILEGLTRRHIPTAVACGILICSLLAGVSFALASHWGLDYLSTWLNAPLGPPLTPGRTGELWLNILHLT